MDHPDVVEANKRPVGADGQVVVVPRVDRQTFGLHQLTAELRQVHQHLRVFAVLPQVVLPAADRRGGGASVSQSLKATGAPSPGRAPPDHAVLGGTPEGVGPHGRRGDALDSVGVIGEHVDGFLHGEVVHVDFSVCCARDQDPVPGVRKELGGRRNETSEGGGG